MAKEDIRSYEVVRIMMRSLFDFQLFRLRGWGGGGKEGGNPGNSWWGCAARFSIRRSYIPVVPSKSIPDSRPNWAMCIPVFRPQRRKNPTRWGDTYLYSLYKGVHPPGSNVSHAGTSDVLDLYKTRRCGSVYLGVIVLRV